MHGLLRVVEIKGRDLEVEYDEVFTAWFKKHMGLKRMSKKRLSKWILDALRSALDA